MSCYPIAAFRRTRNLRRRQCSRNNVIRNNLRSLKPYTPYRLRRTRRFLGRGTAAGRRVRGARAVDGAVVPHDRFWNFRNRHRISRTLWLLHSIGVGFPLRFFRNPNSVPRRSENGPGFGNRFSSSNRHYWFVKNCKILSKCKVLWALNLELWSLEFDF